MGRIARGVDDLALDGAPGLPSELPGVSDAAWEAFVRAVRGGTAVGAVSPSNAVGMYQLTPRRLADLEIVGGVRRVSRPGERAFFAARFRSPMTPERFLRDPEAQYRVFSRSMADYDRRLASGEVPRSTDPKMTRAGALAVLHRAGPGGFASWDRGDRHEETCALVGRVAGIF